MIASLVRLASYRLRVIPCAILLVLSSCASPEAKTKDAILRVLAADERLGKELKSSGSGTVPSRLAEVIAVYCDKLDAIDMVDCPADFRIAYRQHIRAWRDVGAAFKQLPDSFSAGVLVGMFNSLFRHELDGGTSRLEGDLKRAAQGVRSTWEEVERIGAKYGAAL